MSAIVFQDYADDRADLLAARDLNGLRLALVTLVRSSQPALMMASMFMGFPPVPAPRPGKRRGR